MARPAPRPLPCRRCWSGRSLRHQQVPAEDWLSDRALRVGDRGAVRRLAPGRAPLGPAPAHARPRRHRLPRRGRRQEGRLALSDLGTRALDVGAEFRDQLRCRLTIGPQQIARPRLHDPRSRWRVSRQRTRAHTCRSQMTTTESCEKRPARERKGLTFEPFLFSAEDPILRPITCLRQAYIWKPGWLISWALFSRHAPAARSDEPASACPARPPRSWNLSHARP